MDSFANQPVLFERQGERFLAEDMFSRLHRLDGNLGMPMVRRRHQHRVDIVPFKNTAVIGINIGLDHLITLFASVTAPKRFGNTEIRVDIAESDNIDELIKVRHIEPSLPAAADRRETEPAGIAFGTGFGKRVVRSQRRRAGRFQKISPCCHRQY